MTVVHSLRIERKSMSNGARLVLEVALDHETGLLGPGGLPLGKTPHPATRVGDVKKTHCRGSISCDGQPPAALLASSRIRNSSRSRPGNHRTLKQSSSRPRLR